MTLPIDVERARAETPGCEKVLHLDNAGASLPPRAVLDTQLEWLQAEAVTGGYELEHRRARDIEQVYREVAVSSAPTPRRSPWPRTPPSPGIRPSGRCCSTPGTGS